VIFLNKLTIAISTVNSKRNSVIKKINSLSDITKKSVSFLVISQLEDKCEDDILDNIRIIKLTSKGLSKSRNFAIKETSTEWVWFQDDDFVLNELELKNLIYSLSVTNIDIALIRIGSLENRQTYYKKYKDFSKFTRLLSLKVSSIEIIARVDFLRKNKITFNENLGLGTELACCEENQFMLNSFDAGANIHYLKNTLCYHTTLPENRNIDYTKNLKAKGYILKQFPLYISLPLILKWAFTINTGFVFFKNIKLLINGFFAIR
jgi:glycosyltransferase involved in cell wall biosynthesis